MTSAARAALDKQIRQTVETLMELLKALAADADPGEVVATCEAKVERLLRDLKRFKQPTTPPGLGPP